MTAGTFALDGSQAPCNKQDPGMHSAFMTMVNSIEAQRALAELLRLADREGCETIGLGEIAEMIEGMAERLDIAFNPFRHLHLQPAQATQLREARK